MAYVSHRAAVCRLAVRDLVRARDRAMVDQHRARQRLKGFLLPLGHRYTGNGKKESVAISSILLGARGGRVIGHFAIAGEPHFESA